MLPLVTNARDNTTDTHRGHKYFSQFPPSFRVIWRKQRTCNLPLSIIYCPRSLPSVSSPHGNASSQSSQLLQKGACVLVRSRHWFHLLLGKLEDIRPSSCSPPWLNPWCRCWPTLPLLLLVETPLCPERFALQARLREPEAASLLWDYGALPLRVETRHQLGHQTAGLLGVEVAHLLRHVHQGVDLLLVALLRALLNYTACSTDLHWKLLTTCVPHKFSWSKLNVPGTEEY